MRIPDSCHQLKQNLQAQYDTVLKIASAAILEILTQKTADITRVTQFAETLRNAGKTSVPVSILLVINMLSDLEDLPTGLEVILKKVLAHHSFEVVSDNLSPELANIFNSLAVQVCDKPAVIQDIVSERDFISLHNSLGAAQVNIGRDIPTIQALYLNLLAIAELIIACEAADTKVFNYIQQALRSRYSAVRRINNGLYKEKQTTFDEALNARSDSILIKVTQMSFIAGLCASNEEIRSYVSANFEYVARTVNNTAMLIGMWNDCGSETLILSKPDIDRDFISRRLNGNLAQSFRELIIELTRDFDGDDTQGLIQRVMSSEPDANVPNSQRRYLTQPVKDAAKGEPNILLDFGNINTTLELLRKANCYAYLEVQAFLNSVDIPVQLRKIVGGALYQHEILYGGVGDYYDERGDDFLPQLYEQVQKLIVQTVG